ncbi:TIM barrel protein [Paenibacillus sp. GCM10027628]|uniref:TIM barrel protein n=1 Tax=Paenibacillus sp. GCM10027628 TaxID=3273413 RepID=UPI0036371EE0
MIERARNDVFNRLGIITDEVSPNLDEALHWIQEHGLQHVEIRMVDGKNVMGLTDEEARMVLKRVEAHGLYISSIASPIFKCPLDPNREVRSGDTFGQSAMEDVTWHFRLLERAFNLADLMKTSCIRIFSFWREEIPEQFEDEIVNYLRKAAAAAEKRGKLLLLENEPACNGGCAEEVGRLTEKTDSPALKVLWDPGNEAFLGRKAFPDGYEAVKHVLGHVHLKDSIFRGYARAACVPISWGEVDYIGQLHALEQDDYQGLFSMETHYVPQGGVPAEGSALSLLGLQNLHNKESMLKPLHADKIDRLHVQVYANRKEMGIMAGIQGAVKIRELLEKQEQLRIIFAAAPSQNEFLDTLSKQGGIDWKRITVFHMDEYMGLPDEAPQKFSHFLQTKLFDIVQPGQVHLLNSSNSPIEECLRYSALLNEAPIDIVFLGIGENGHIAFNDPPIASFNDSEAVKIVDLDLTSRQQQVNDGCFRELESVPTQAITLTIPTLLSAHTMFCVVPGPTKRQAIEATLFGAIEENCPASILRTHANCTLYVDMESAEGLF